MAADNQLASTGNTVDEILAADVIEGQMAFSNSILKFYSVAGSSGDKSSPNVANTVIRVKKTNTTDVFAVLADVFIDTTAQEALTAGGDGKGGVAAAASANGDTHVLMRMNE